MTQHNQERPRKNVRSEHRLSRIETELGELGSRVGMDREAWYPRDLAKIDSQCWHAFAGACWPLVGFFLSILGVGAILAQGGNSGGLLLVALLVVGTGLVAGQRSFSAMRLYRAMDPVDPTDQAALYQSPFGAVAEKYHSLLIMAGRTHLVQDDLERILRLQYAARQPAGKTSTPAPDADLTPAVFAGGKAAMAGRLGSS